MVEVSLSTSVCIHTYNTHIQSNMAGGQTYRFITLSLLL